VGQVYFATILALLGFLRDGPAEDEVERRRVTYARWAKKGDANPIRFSDLSEDLLRSLRDTGSVFARKFGAGSVSEEEWARLLESASGSTIRKRRVIVESSEASESRIASSSTEDLQLPPVALSVPYDCVKIMSEISGAVSKEEKSAAQGGYINEIDEHVAKKQRSG
jgi:hypothetical protein